MKPTTEQKQWLKEHLYETLTYKETHDEVYDHILLALENVGEEEPFEAGVSKIIKYNFGGTYGLMKLEKDCIESTAVTAKAQYWSIFKRWFLSPLVIATFILFLLFFRLHQIKGADAWLMPFYFVLLLMPVLLFGVRSYGLKHKYGNTRSAIKDMAIEKITYKANRILCSICTLNSFYTYFRMWLFDYHRVAYKMADIINSRGYTGLIWIGISSATFTFIIIHILSVIELYRTEFELKVIS